MSEPTNENQTMTQYLLGGLPAAETERLDERSVSDGDFAEALRAAENDLVDAYVQEELTGEALERFKTYYLSSPLRSDKMHFAQALQGWAQQNAEEVRDEAPARSASARGSRASSISRLFTTPRLSLRWGLAAAAMVFLVTASWLLFENMRVRSEVAQNQPQRQASSQPQPVNQQAQQPPANTESEPELAQGQGQKPNQDKLQPPSSTRGVTVASFILSPQLRNAGKITTVALHPDTDYVAFRLNLDPDDNSAYQVSLLDQNSNQVLWRSGNLKARQNVDGKTLSVRLHSGVFKPRQYVIRVSGVSPSGSSETVGEYLFRVLKE